MWYEPAWRTRNEVHGKAARALQFHPRGDAGGINEDWGADDEDRAVKRGPRAFTQLGGTCRPRPPGSVSIRWNRQAPVFIPGWVPRGQLGHPLGYLHQFIRESGIPTWRGLATRPRIQQKASASPRTLPGRVAFGPQDHPTDDKLKEWRSQGYHTRPGDSRAHESTWLGTVPLE